MRGTAAGEVEKVVAEWRIGSGRGRCPSHTVRCSPSCRHPGYPLGPARGRFRRVMTAQEFVALTPLAGEIEWARERCRSEEHLFGLVLGLKCFQRLGYFPRQDQLPVEVIERVRSSLGLSEGTLPDAARRTAAWQRELIRERVGAVFDPERARSLAE